MPIVIGITGISCSGKTTFCEKLHSVTDKNIIVISQDSFYRGSSGRLADSVNFDDISEIDVESLLDVLAHLSSGRNAQIPVYDFAKHERTGYTDVESPDVIVLEGHLIFTDEKIRKNIDFLIYLDIEEDIALARRVTRDVVERGRDIEEVVGRYLNYVNSANKSISYVKKFSDVIFPENTNNDSRYEMIGAYLSFLMSNSDN